MDLTKVHSVAYVTPNGDKTNSFQNAMSSVLVTAQCFGVMPVMGITGSSAVSLRFRWCSFRAAFSIITTLGACLNMMFSFALMKSGLNFAESENAVFFGGVTTMYLLFLQLARRWPSLAIEWENLELSQKHYGYPKTLKLKIKIITTIILLGALVEHLLSKASLIAAAAEDSDGVSEVLHNYFTNTGTYNQIFVIMKYNAATAILTLLSNFISTFVWNFTDLFIILVSVSLAARFRLYNQQLQSLRGKLLPETFWIKMREEYNSLSYLTRTLDSCISKIIFVSFGNNLYFICRQLLFSLSPMEGLIDMIYFCYSFGFLLFRMILLSLYASSIYEESKKPRYMLYAVPSESYQTEVSRLMIQVVTDNVALTGMGFFYVTRTLLLTLAGTIVTYEIVLVQFNSINSIGNPSDQKPNTTELCHCQQ